MSHALNTILIVLGLPKPVAKLIVRMTQILDAMLANKTIFVSPPVAISLALAQTRVAALGSAEGLAKGGGTAAIQARDAARKLVIEDANQLHGYVQQLANATPAEAATIAAAAAMALRKNSVKPKHDLVVKQTVSGTIKIVAGNVLGARSHEWQYSLDGGKTWTALPPTAQASTTVTGLTPATIVQVRHHPASSRPVKQLDRRRAGRGELREEGRTGREVRPSTLHHERTETPHRKEL